MAGGQSTGSSRRELLQRVGSGLAALAITRTSTAAPSSPVVSGVTDPGLASFDRLMTKFVLENKVPGAALAVTRRGRLVYARGFGLADAERSEPVCPSSLFRIASISKPLTAVAVLQLVERGKLKLDDRVCDLLEVRLEGEPLPPRDSRLRRVTVRHLLQHRGGWDRDKSFDPMGRSVAIARAVHQEPPAMPDAIIAYMWRRPLDFDPGTRSCYSNFGYCLLGRLIENASGLGYEAYVRKEVLAPLGIRDMRIGGTLLEKRAPREVHYYDGKKNQTAPAVLGPSIGKPVPLPYGAWSLEAMDAHGGWIGSAPDIVRFGAAFDDPARCPILSASSIRVMFERPEGRAGHRKDGSPEPIFYGCGWQVGHFTPRGTFTSWHSGELYGTSSLLVRRFDGLDWAVLFNTRKSPKGKSLAVLIDPLLHHAADEVKHWPEQDLFGKINNDWERRKPSPQSASGPGC